MKTKYIASIASSAVLLTAICSCQSQAFYPQQKSFKEIQEIARSMEPPDDVKGSIASMVERSVTSTQAGDPAFRKAFKESLTAKMTADGLIEAITEAEAKVYAQYFTAQEMDEIGRFYSSQAGRKLIASIPALRAAAADAGAKYAKGAVKAAMSDAAMASERSR